MQSDFNSKAFRYDCATFIKYLLAAREKDQPGFVTPEVRARWDLEDGFESELTVAQYLISAKRRLQHIDVRYSEPGGSLGIGKIEHGSVGKLQMDISFLIRHENGLNEAIRAAESGQEIDWQALADWDTLPDIRNALDRIEVPAEDEPAPVAASKCVQLFGLREQPVVNDRRKSVLGERQYELIQRLIEAGEGGCSKSQLEVITSNYWKSLKSLKESDDDWNSVIHFPGVAYGSYWIS